MEDRSEITPPKSGKSISITIECWSNQVDAKIIHATYLIIITNPGPITCSHPQTKQLTPTSDGKSVGNP